MKKIFTFIIATAIISNTMVNGAVLVDTSIVVSNIKNKLLFLIPNNYDKHKQYPLVIALHKHYQYGGNAVEYRNCLKPVTDSLNYIVACPENTVGSFTNAQVLASIDSAKSMFSIDLNSVYLNGMSINGAYVLQEGLKNIFAFKGVFAWAPYNPNPASINLNTKIPVVLAIGTSDDYGINPTIQVYDSLIKYGADVNLILLPGIKHVDDFADFGKEMIHCLQYINDSNKISIQPVNSAETEIEMVNTENPKEVKFKVGIKSSSDLLFSSVCSDVSIVSNPDVTFTSTDSIVKVTIKPLIGKSGVVRLIFEAKEKNGTAIKQVTLKVSVTKPVTVLNNLDINSHFIISPIPAFDHLVLESKQNITNAKYEIISMSGQLMQKSVIESQKTDIDISPLKSGLYLLRISTSNGISAKKFIKQ